MDNLFLKIRNNVKDLHKSRLINPKRHWNLLIKLFLLIAVVLIFLGFYSLYIIRNEHFSQVSTSINTLPPMVKDKLLKNITDAFNNKKIQAEKAKATVFDDPSQS